MITKTDSMSTVEFDSYYVILPSMQRWDIDKFSNESHSSKGKMCPTGFSYSSETNDSFLGVEELNQIIKSEFSL